MSAKSACIATIDHFAALRGDGALRMIQDKSGHRGVKPHRCPCR